MVKIAIDGELDLDLACPDLHASLAMETTIEGFSVVNIARAAAHIRGILGRAKHAEGFIPLRLFNTLD